jgi:hypothetical protein
MLHLGFMSGVYYQNSSNVIYFYQVRCMHVHVMAPGQRLYDQVM